MVWRVAEGVAGRAVMGALQVAHVVTRDESSSATTSEATGSAQATRTRPQDTEADRPKQPRRTERAGAPAPDSPPSAPSIASPPIASPPIARRPTSPQEMPPPAVPEPVHVSEEPELVREEAEAGAEDGAGASITINPPWEGYDRLGARDVITRLSGADAAELAAVQLYESSNRSRQTVLDAVRRQLKAANARG
jgi:type IV secretory pathway VirB10-like protein